MNQTSLLPDKKSLDMPKPLTKWKTCLLDANSFTQGERGATKMPNCFLMEKAVVGITVYPKG
jgi:hypothetical protein